MIPQLGRVIWHTIYAAFVLAVSFGTFSTIQFLLQRGDSMGMTRLEFWRVTGLLLTQWYEWQHLRLKTGFITCILNRKKRIFITNTSDLSKSIPSWFWSYTGHISSELFEKRPGWEIPIGVWLTWANQWSKKVIDCYYPVPQDKKNLHGV